MAEIRDAGIDEIIVSWWGRGSPEDSRLALVVGALGRTGSPSRRISSRMPAGRSRARWPTSPTCVSTGSGRSTSTARSTCRSPTGRRLSRALHAGGATLFAQTPLVGAAAAAGFDGIYTYDIVTYGGSKFARLCAEAHARHLLCAPSVGPGYDARRGSGDPVVKPRRQGATYDAMWRAAITAHADRVTITSYNEWHEGTQIEPAATAPWHGRYRYLSYNGAWGLHGHAAEGAYLARTRYWSDVFRSTSLAQPKTKAP